MDDGRDRRWSAVSIVLVGEAIVAVLVLGVAWWPGSGATQSPLAFGEGLYVAAFACTICLVPIALLAAATRIRHPNVRGVVASLLGVAVGTLTFAAAFVTAVLRLEDQHEA